jgi:Flp pilus assembly protein TadG
METTTQSLDVRVRIRRQHEQRHFRQGGQSLLEFAIVLPVLLLLGFGITEFGRAYYQYNTLSKAIREGARYMSSQPYSDATIASAQNMVVYGKTTGTASPVLPGLTTDMVSVTPGGGIGSYDAINPPKTVTLQIANYRFVPLVPALINLNVTFSPQVVFRYVGPNATFTSF